MAKVTQHLKDWVRNMKILNAIIFLQFLQILPIIFASEILNSNIEQAQFMLSVNIWVTAFALRYELHLELPDQLWCFQAHCQ